MIFSYNVCPPISWGRGGEELGLANGIDQTGEGSAREMRVCAREWLQRLSIEFAMGKEGCKVMRWVKDCEKEGRTGRLKTGVDALRRDNV